MSAVASDLQRNQLDTGDLIEAVLGAPDPHIRAAIIPAVVQDLGAAVKWVDDEAPAAELAGVDLGSTAQRHHLRMRFSADPAQVPR